MITVVGWDGSPLSVEAEQALASATLVVGGARHLAAVQVPQQARTVVLGSLERGLAELSRDRAGRAVVIASGDPGFFGIVRAIRRAGMTPTVLPAVSSVALAFARLGLAWDDALVVTTHGRGIAPAVNVCRSAPKVAVLTGPGAGPSELGAALVGSYRTLHVLTSLGTADEEWLECSPEEAALREWREPNVVLSIAPGDPGGPPRWLGAAIPAPRQWALPESGYLHRDSMVTKAEVRALVLARLGPGLGRCVWDVGAGSGSIAVECARFGAYAVAIEREAEACARIEANAGSHAVEVTVVHGDAPEVLAGLPAPDAVFVGGGGLPAVLGSANRRPGRVVAAFTAMDHALAARAVLRERGYTVDGVQLAANRFAELPDDSVRLAATNPVFVVWGIRLDTGPESAAGPAGAGDSRGSDDADGRGESS
jgi:precorrin-6B C5,15-methyltransferase / cobalt-precorrin-6B C5,C15-methyltransferase